MTKLQIQIEIEYKSKTEAELTLFLPCEKQSPTDIHHELIDSDRVIGCKSLNKSWGKISQDTQTRYSKFAVTASDLEKLNLEIDNAVRYIKVSLIDIKNKNILPPKKCIKFEI